MKKNLIEQLIASVLNGNHSDSEECKADYLQKALGRLGRTSTEAVRVVLIGGGTGLSNILGGDSRSSSWPQRPFAGIKEIFPRNTSIVCVTDDGGSSGELLKDLPLIAVGDLRHVLLSSITRRNLQQKYQLSASHSGRVAETLFRLFNCRFIHRPESIRSLISLCAEDSSALPDSMHRNLLSLLEKLFDNPEFSLLFDRQHCLGNLFLVSSIYRNREKAQEAVQECFQLCVSPQEFLQGINYLADLIGSSVNGVLPCTTTPARLKILYNNGVLITGEYKSAYADRKYPVDRLVVEFSAPVEVPPEALRAIADADIILLAPGSLYTSTLPVLQVPGIADAIRNNIRAMKVLISNLWVQKGETDLVLKEPGRRFHVSDLVNAYQNNIPAGVSGLFNYILALGLKDIPGSILQNYAVEGKIPIYLDKAKIEKMGFTPIEAGFFDQQALLERKVVHHEPDALAKSVKVLWSIFENRDPAGQHKTEAWLGSKTENHCKDNKIQSNHQGLLPCRRYSLFSQRIKALILPAVGELHPSLKAGMRQWLSGIFWRHADIPLGHLDFIQGVRLIPVDLWKRNQQWDNVFSFYDPEERFINLRDDLVGDLNKLEGAFIVALGQSLLGNYAEKKELIEVKQMNEMVGKMYCLTLRHPKQRNSHFSAEDLDYFLQLVRMRRLQQNCLIYTRLNNASEGFTPPGLLMGLMYAWYLDNRFAAHIEYKMAIMRNEISNLIPEQVKMLSRRRALIDFFREKVFTG